MNRWRDLAACTSGAGLSRTVSGSCVKRWRAFQTIRLSTNGHRPWCALGRSLTRWRTRRARGGVTNGPSSWNQRSPTAAHKFDEAAHEVRKALEIWPASRLFYCHLGDALLRLDQPADAEASYTRALALDLNDYLANLRMGELRQMQGHLADARRYMERAVHARPSSREARQVLSELSSE